MRIADVANMVKSKIDHVNLLLWNTNLDSACESNLCCGPMPLNYEKLAATVQTILAAIECPVCLNTISTPFTQCQNGHLLCLRCRARSERCPICRDRYSVVRCLLAEQVKTSLGRHHIKIYHLLFNDTDLRNIARDFQSSRRTERKNSWANLWRQDLQINSERKRRIESLIQ